MTTDTPIDWAEILKGFEDDFGFPASALPKDAMEYARAVSEARQVSVGMTVPLMLATMGASTAGGIVVEAPDGYPYGLATYVIVVADPSERKSSIQGAVVLKPLYGAFEHIKEINARRLGIEIAKSEIAEREAKKLKTKSDDPKEIAAAFARSTKAKAIVDLYKTPAFVTTDPTPEALENLMASQNGCALVSSAEGAFVENLSGRHGDSVSMALINDGWSRGHIRTVRVKRGDVEVPIAHLGLALLVQKSVAEKLSEEKFESTGFLSRVWFTAPESMVGSRKARVEPVPLEFTEWWTGTVRRTLRRGWGNIETPHVVTMSEDAKDVWESFFYVAEGRAIRNDSISGWWGKAPEMVARAAGLMALMEDPDATSISGATMSAAVRIVEFFADEAQLFYTGVIEPEMGKEKLRLLERIRKWQRVHLEVGDTYTSSKLAGKLKGSRAKVSAADVTAIHLETLVPKGVVERVPATRKTSFKWRYFGEDEY